ncbi:hypothetical protein FQR65_LT14242 [Abscondita terminalis]|nr:hypothetical protein FQR65_LT14242 [Abscondita terminalis]
MTEIERTCKICLNEIIEEPEPNNDLMLKPKLEFPWEQDLNITDNPIACNVCKIKIDAAHSLHFVKEEIKHELFDDDIKTDNVIDDDCVEFNTDIDVCFEESNSREEINGTQQEIRKITPSVEISRIPDKSRHVYEKRYKKFTQWCEENHVTNISENVLLAYFQLQTETYKSSTLWVIYSMLRSCLNIYKHVDISQYKQLQRLLQQASVGYTPKKSMILDEDDVYKFIKEADDNTYLAMKVILIIEYNGASRRELTSLAVEDVDIKSDRIIVSISKTKKFSITNMTWIKLIKKYIKLRPDHIINHRFFLTYRNGYCINHPIGSSFNFTEWMLFNILLSDNFQQIGVSILRNFITIIMIVVTYMRTALPLTLHA